MKIYYLFKKGFIAVCCMTLVCCGNKKLVTKNSSAQVVEHPKVPSIKNSEVIFYVKSPDIESDLCAQAAIQALTRLPGKPRVEYQKIDDGYQNGFLKIHTSERKLITESEIQQILEAEGFTIEEMLVPSQVQEVMFVSDEARKLENKTT